MPHISSFFDSDKNSNMWNLYPTSPPIFVHTANEPKLVIQTVYLQCTMYINMDYHIVHATEHRFNVEFML